MDKGLVVKLNLSCGNKVSYFTDQWTEHSWRQQVNSMTDVILVGQSSDRNRFEEIGVHKAVIMKLCPILASTSYEIFREDPVFLFPDDSVDVINAFVKFIYEGYFVVTQKVSVDDVFNFMKRVGLYLNPGSFQVCKFKVIFCIM